MRLDVIMLGNLPRNHAAQEQLNLLEKSIYTRAIDPDRSESVREKMENYISVAFAHVFLSFAHRRRGSVRDKK